MNITQLLILCSPWCTESRILLLISCRSLEPCAKQFRHIVEFSLGCESQLMRCAAVRMCARAAGLGGGMGCFLAEPFIEEVVRLSRRETPMSTDHYHIVEYLLTLCMWPAMKVSNLQIQSEAKTSIFALPLILFLLNIIPSERNYLCELCAKCTTLQCAALNSMYVLFYSI